MSQYRLIFTNIGLSKKQNAELNNDFIHISHFGVGSGVITSLNPSMTGLLIEEYRANINSVDTKNGITIFDLIVPSEIGGFWIKEVALFDIDGDCICIGTVPITYKVRQDEGASKAVHLKVSTTSTNTENIVFNTDNSLVYATVDYVNTKTKGTINLTGEVETRISYLGDKEVTSKATLNIKDMPTADNINDNDLVIVDIGATKNNKKTTFLKIWDYISGKLNGAVSTIKNSDLATDRVVISSSTGKITVSTITKTILGYLANVTSDIQTQLNSKAPQNNPSFSGTAWFSGIINADGGLTQDGHSILNGSDTWIRTKDSTGWFNATYGGGIYMADTTWVRVYNNKGFRVDNILSVGGTGYIDGDLVVGEGKNSSSIHMRDNDEGSRTIHCNSNRIGFLKQDGNWGSYCNDDGSFASDVAMVAPNFYGVADKAKFLDMNALNGQGNCNLLFWNTPPHSVSCREVNGFSDAPNTGWWFIESRRHSNGSNIWGTQIAYGWENNANAIYQRNVSSSNWSSWVKIPNEYEELGGKGQSWQDVTSIRALNVTYTNNTNKPIVVNIRVDRNTVSTAGFGVYINNLFVPVAYNTNSGGGNTSIGNIIIPRDATYKVVIISESAYVGSWHELR